MKSPITNSLFARILTRGLSGLFVLGLFCFSFAKADINDGFIHGYWFDNSYSDVMGSASGTACRTISISEDGLFGQAILCNGGYVRLEDSHGTGFGIADGKDGKLTIMCWYNPSSAATSERVLISNSAWNSGKNPGVVLDAQYKGGPYYNIGDGTDRIDLNANVPVVANEWQFAAITADLTTNQAYLYYGTANGTLQQFQVDSAKLQNIDSLLSTYKWYIGEDYKDYYFYGLIDEMGIWNRALSFGEINQIYTAQQGGTSLGNQLNFASSAVTIQAGAYTDASTWAGGVVPSADADVTINNAVTSEGGRTFNGEAVIGEDGSLSAAGCVFVGHSIDANGKLTINGGDNVFSGNANNNYSSSLIIGFQGGNGEFVLNDGTVTTSGYTYVSYNADGEAKFTQNGGTYNAGNNIAVAYNANEVATLSVTGGEMNVNGAIRIGIGANSTGQMTVSGGKVTATNFQIGRASAGDSAKLVITGGVVEVTDAIYGSSSKASGNVYISGTGQLVFNSTNTGNGIRELTSFKIEGSGADGTGALLFKQSLKGAAPITLTGDTTIGIEPGATFTQAAAISGSSGLTITGGGTMELTANSTYTGATTVSAGTLVLGTAGNTIVAPGGSSIKTDGGSVRVDGNLNVDSGILTVKGDWTGNGDIQVNKGAQLRITTSFSYPKDITLNGGTLRNATDGRTVSFDAPINVISDSYLQSGWSDYVTLKGALKGTGNITVPSDSGYVIFSGDASQFKGALSLQSNIRVGKSGTDSTTDCVNFIGDKKITLYSGGLIQNNDNNITITNDLDVQGESGFKTGWKKSITLTGNVTGSGKLKQVSDSGWLILKTHSDNDAFTGPFQTGWASTSSRGQTRLAANQPLGANAGVLYNYGYLDMNGFSQIFKGVVDDGANNKKGRIYNTTTNKSTLTFDITSQNLSYAGTIESNIELIVNATGAGTQTFTNGGSSFTGNATINGGTIRMTGKGSSGNSPIGKVSDTRFVYVNSGAELVFANQDVLANAHNYAPINFVVNGGKISNEGAYYNFLQNPTFKNGGQLYATDGSATWKAFKLLNVTVARNDDDTAGAPVLFSSAPNMPNATITFADISDIVEAGTSVATINVAEITSADKSVNDNVADLVISAVIEDPVYKTDGALKNAGEIKKTGAGTMEFTASNTYTGKTSVKEGTLRLTDAAVATHGPIAVDEIGTLEFNISSGQTKKMTVDAANAITSTGSVVKTGSGTLQIDTASTGLVNASSFLVSTGRLDMKEYFTGTMEVGSGATLSPGNSVGTLTIDGSYNQDKNGILLLEVGKNDQGEIVVDQLIVNGTAAFESGSIINISLDPSSGLVGGDTFSDLTLLTADNAANIFDNVVIALQSYYFTDLVPTLSGNQILLSGRLDPNAVPEPSTWALLILGVAGLLYVRKRK